MTEIVSWVRLGLAAVFILVGGLLVGSRVGGTVLLVLGLLELGERSRIWLANLLARRRKPEP